MAEVSNIQEAEVVDTAPIAAEGNQPRKGFLSFSDDGRGVQFGGDMRSFSPVEQLGLLQLVMHSMLTSLISDAPPEQ